MLMQLMLAEGKWWQALVHQSASQW